MFWEWRWWRNGGVSAYVDVYSERKTFQCDVAYANPTYSVTLFPKRFYITRADLPWRRREIAVFPWQPLTMNNLER